MVLFIGSGMGIGHVSADHYLNSDSPFSGMPVCGLIDTRTAGERWITDAAAAATALSTGVNVNTGVLSIDQNSTPVATLLEVAKQYKKLTGVITTTSLTYAVPAAFMVHSDNWGREYEIAHQIFESNTHVLLGGGRRFFESNTVADTNLIPLMEEKGYTFISQQNQLAVLNPAKTDKLLGLFATEALRQARHRSLSLKMMTEKAVGILEKNRNGFVLVVEGSQIDWRAHEKDDDGLLAEMQDFTEAIRWTLDYQKAHPDLLIVVTGTNETGGIFLVQDNQRKGQTGIKFVTGQHTANLCPVFAKGPQSETIHGIISNADLGKHLISFIKE
ncbi:MAG: alkaline phosphatase [bacterium]